MKFSDFFNTYDTTGTQHTGFLQSMNFTGILSDIPMLNELTMAFMDAHLYNELSGSLVLRQWGEYMTYSKEHDRHEIKAQFYADFVAALYAKLTKSEKWFELLETDFKSISVTELETINHGKKETEDQKGQGQRTNVYGADIKQRDYGQTQDTNAYGADITQTEYGQTQDTNAYGADVKQMEYGATSTTRAYDKVTVDITHGQDTHLIGAAHIATSNTTTNQIYPLGAADFVNDSKSVVAGTQDNNAQTNTDTWGNKKDETAARNDTESALAHTDVTTTAAKTDTLTGAAHTDVESRAARTDTVTGAAHTDVESRATRTDTVTDAQRTDTQTIKAYTDTINRVKHIVISPEKYFEIEKELANIGVYDLMLEAVKETMLLSVWEEDGFVW